MKLWRGGILLWLAALPVFAGTIDVTGQTQVTLASGDTLDFTFSVGSYLRHAAQFQAPAYPAQIDFVFATAGQASSADFSAELLSGDGSISVAFDNVAVSYGLFQGALYNGPVWTVSGALDLAPSTAEGIFAGPAVLALSSPGSGVTVGLPPYLSAQTMLVSLSGGGLSVGGVTYSVSLEEPPPAGGDPPLVSMDDLSADGPQDAPEAGSGRLLAGGGALLLAVRAALKRFERAGIRRKRAR
jgi:hypothetical protein